MSDFYLLFLKFVTVGGFGFGVDMLSTWLLKERMNLSKYVSNSIGFIIGIIFRFVVNKFWTFNDNNPDWLLQLAKFGLIAAVGLPLVNGIIYLLTERYKWMSFYKAKTLAMIVFMFWNFSANYFWTFEVD